MTLRRGGAVDRICVAVATGLYLSYIPSWFSEKIGLRRGRLTGAGIVGTLWGWALLYALPEGPRYAAFLALAMVLACAPWPMSMSTRPGP